MNRSLLADPINITNPLYFAFFSYVVVFVLSVGLTSILFSQYSLPPIILGSNIFFIIVHIVFVYWFVYSELKTNSSHFYLKLLFFSLLFCIFYLLEEYALSYFYTPYSFPFSITGKDQFVYHQEALHFCNALNGDSGWGFYNSYNTDDRGFFSWVGLLFYLFGESHFVVLLFNAFFHSATACILVGAVNEAYRNGYIARLSGIIYAFLPTMGHLSSLMLKETVMMFLVSCWLLCLLKAYRLKSVRCAVLSIAFVTLIFYFRSFLGVLVLLLSFVYVFSKNRKVLLGALCIGVLVLVYNGDIITKRGDNISKGYSQLQRQTFYKKNNSFGHVEKVGGLITLFPLSPMMPVPSTLDARSSFDVTKVASLYRIHQEIIRIVLMFFFYLGLFYLCKKKLITVSLLFLFGALAILCVNSYIGTLTYYRYQATALFFQVPIIILGMKFYEEDNRRNTLLFLLYSFGVICLISLYNIYRVNIIYNGLA